MSTKTVEVNLIPVEEIELTHRNPRLDFSKDALIELADSLKKHGQIQPIVVRRKGEKYELVVGERRVRAAIYADIPKLRAEIVDLTDNEADARRLIENLQRQDLDIWEKVDGLETYWERYLRVEKAANKYEELARVIGSSEATIQSWYSLARDTEVSGERNPFVRKLALSALSAIAPFPSKEQERLAKAIVKNGLSRDDVRSLVKLYLRNPDVDVDALASKSKTKLETVAVTLPKERAEEIRKESQEYLKKISAKSKKALQKEIEIRREKKQERDRHQSKRSGGGSSSSSNTKLVTDLTKDFLAHKEGIVSPNEQYNQVMTAYASGRLTRGEADLAAELWKESPKWDVETTIREAKARFSEEEARRRPQPVSLLMEPELYGRIRAYSDRKKTDFKDAVYNLLDYALDQLGYKGGGV